MIDRKSWEAEKSYYSKVISGIVKRKIYVKDAGNQELGYTKDGNVIFIAPDHEIYKQMRSDESRMFRFGVAVHEGLHQVFTNFNYFVESQKRLKRTGFIQGNYDLEMYATLMNLVEDPAIENLASQVIGGTALEALDFSIAKMNELAPDIGNDTYPMEEIINALIQFGDLGVIHGEFRWKTARKIFLEIAPLFYDAIYEPNNRLRIDKVLPIYKICFPLWSSYSEKKKEEMISRMKKVMEKNNKNDSISSGKGDGRNGEEPDEDQADGANAKRKRQKVLLAKIKQTQSQRNGEQLETKQGSSQGQASQEPDNQENSFSEHDKEDSTSEEQNEKEKIAPAQRETDPDTKDEENSHSEYEDSPDDANGDSELEDPEEIEPAKCSEMALKILDDLIKEEKGTLPNRLDEQKEYLSQIPEYQIPFSQKAPAIKCFNQIVTSEYQDTEIKYDGIIEKMEDRIEELYEELDLIFQNDRARKFYSDTGRISLNRIASGKKTTKLFRKRQRPADKQDFCIGIIGDASGSMSNKIQQECAAIIALAEVFSKFEIPLYFLDFHCDYQENYQRHYIRWNNTRYERERLLYMKAGGNNFDSYSIRYMTSLLMERNEKHKLLFVLSDGLPSAGFEFKEGIIENTRAIEDARAKKIGVIGLGIGDGINEVKFREMYGKENFIKVTNSNDLFDNLASIITYVVDGWN